LPSLLQPLLYSLSAAGSQCGSSVTHWDQENSRSRFTIYETCYKRAEFKRSKLQSLERCFIASRRLLEAEYIFSIKQ